MLGAPRDDGGRRKDSGAQHRSQQNSVTEGSNVVRVGNEGTARLRQRTRQHAGDVVGNLSAPERRKPSLDPRAKTEQGWPSWLMAVAGDAIRDWTPRRANTFEKLAKVIRKINSVSLTAVSLFPFV